MRNEMALNSVPVVSYIQGLLTIQGKKYVRMQTVGGQIVKLWSDRWSNRKFQSQIQMAGPAERGMAKSKYSNNHCGLAGDGSFDDSLLEQLMGISEKANET